MMNSSETSSMFLFNPLDLENSDIASDIASDIKREIESNVEDELILSTNKRKFEIKSEPFNISTNSNSLELGLIDDGEPPKKKRKIDNNNTDGDGVVDGGDGGGKGGDADGDAVGGEENTNTNTNTTETNDNQNKPINAMNQVFSFQHSPVPEQIQTHQPYFIPIPPHHPHTQHNIRPPPAYFVPIHHSYNHHPHSGSHGYHHQFINPYNGYPPVPITHIIPPQTHAHLMKNEINTQQSNNKNNKNTNNNNSSNNNNNKNVKSLSASSSSRRGRRRRNTSKRNKITNNNLLNNNENNLNDDSLNNDNNQLMSDKSPFKTTYISIDEELELKNTNNTLYTQFNNARQAIYQQYKQKIDSIHHNSNLMNIEKKKLNIKIAAIDAKIQEKKLFLSYLEMSKPQPNSWLISNSTLSINPFHQNKIVNKQSSKYANLLIGKKNKKITKTDSNNNNNSNNDKNTTHEEKENSQSVSVNTKVNNTNNNNEQKTTQPMKTAKRVKKPKFSEYNVRVLRDWYETHTNNPYPSSSEKHLMCELTGLTKYQVSRWFCNVRTRKPPPELSDNDEDININNTNNNSNINHSNIIRAPPVIATSSDYHHHYGPPHAHHQHHPHLPHIQPPSPYHPHYATAPPPLSHHHHLASLAHHISPVNMNVNMNMNMNMNTIPPIPIHHAPINHHLHYFPIHAGPQVQQQQRTIPGSQIQQQISDNNNETNLNNDNDNNNNNDDGLMPQIQSTFYQQQPPPLIDENSNQQ